MNTRSSLRLALVGVGIALVLGACGDGGGCFEDGPEPSITVTSPTGGENWAVASEHEITWESAGVESVRVELSRDGGGTWEELAASEDAGAGTYAWTVAGPCSPHCAVRVLSTSDAAVTGTSEEFTIWSGVVWYVDDDAAGGDGTTWATAFQHPQDAVDAASEGDEVWVAGGTYIRRSDPDLAVLDVGTAVAIYGGLAAGAVTREGRDLVGNESVLDGELTRRVVYCVADLTFDGFTVTRGAPGGMMNRLCSPVIRNCSFVDNQGGEGGGMCNLYASPSVIDCLFEGNTGTCGAGMKNTEEGSVFVSGCRFVSNTASVISGGIDNFYGSSLVVTNCVFWANDGARFGGGIHNSRASAVITNCVFFGNTAVLGGGAFHNETMAGTATITNCILWGNTATSGEPEIETGPGSTTTVTYSCVEGGWTGVGNIGELAEHDPLFVDPDGPDGIPGNEDDDFHLSASSPCIDAGDPASTVTEDIEGNPRPAGSGYDMGAYEYQP